MEAQMPRYLSLGDIPKKRHTAHRTQPGYRNEGIFYEEVISTQGFSRAYSIAYHRYPPTRVKSVEAAGNRPVERIEQATLRHHHVKTGQIPANGDPITGRVPIFTNNEVTLWRCRPNQPQGDLYRNAIAEEIVFVHKGSGTLHTHFGKLPIKPFDYVVIPRCTTYRLEFEGRTADLLVIESAGTIEFPRRYLNPDGQLKLGAPYCERDLHGPTELLTIDRTEDTPVLIKGLPPGCSTRTRMRSRCHTPTRMWRVTRCCITFAGSSAAAAAWRNHRSRSTRTASRMARTPAPSSPARTPSGPTNSP
jgi:homogentisate 1,2-dioxygenase